MSARGAAYASIWSIPVWWTRRTDAPPGPGGPREARGHIPFGRQATAWEVAYAVLFFISEESAYVTAQTLAVDSGLSGM